ncbi:MAG: hypothetical protein N2645_00275 [Clostridia bacterium]|nr:hypothetical protein [Clostridia bacterium]
MRFQPRVNKIFIILGILISSAITLGILSIFASEDTYRAVTVNPSIAKVGENITITGENFGKSGFVASLEIVSNDINIANMDVYNGNMKSIYAGSPIDNDNKIVDGRFSITTQLRELRGYDIPDGTYRVGIWWLEDEKTTESFKLSDYTFIVFSNGQVIDAKTTPAASSIGAKTPAPIKTPTSTPSPTVLTEMRIIQQPPEKLDFNEARKSQPFDVTLSLTGKWSARSKISATLADESGETISTGEIFFDKGNNSYSNLIETEVVDGKAAFKSLIVYVKDGSKRERITLHFVISYSMENMGIKDIKSNLILLDRNQLSISDSKLLFSNVAAELKPLCGFPLPALNDTGNGAVSGFRDGSLTGLTAEINITDPTARIILAGNAGGTEKPALDGELEVTLTGPDGKWLPAVNISPTSNHSGPVDILPSTKAIGKYGMDITFKKKGSTLGAKNIYFVGMNGAKLDTTTVKEKFIVEITPQLSGQALKSAFLYQTFDINVYAPGFIETIPFPMLKNQDGSSTQYLLFFENINRSKISKDGFAVIRGVYIYGNKEGVMDTAPSDKTMTLAVQLSVPSSAYTYEGTGAELVVKKSGFVNLNALWNHQMSWSERSKYIPSLAADGNAASNWGDRRIINQDKPLNFGAWAWTFTAEPGNKLILSGDKLGTTPFKARQTGELKLTRLWKNPSDNKHYTQDYTLKLSDAVSGDGYKYELKFGTGAGEYPAGQYSARFVLTATEDKFGASTMYVSGFGVGISDIQIVKSDDLFEKFVIGNDTMEIPVGVEKEFPIVIKSTGFKMYGLAIHPDFDRDAVEITKVTAPSGMRVSFYGMEKGHTAWVSVNPEDPSFEGLEAGDTYFSLWVKPKKPGIWTIALTGNYGWSNNPNALSMYSGVGSTITVKATGSGEYKAVDTGIYIADGEFLSDGPFRMTLTGSGIHNSNLIQLIDIHGVATTMDIVENKTENMIAAQKAGMSTGLYTIKVKDVNGKEIKLAGDSEIVVPPAAPIFGVERIDREPQLPSMDVTHIWRVTNYGTTDGYASVMFIIPWYAQLPKVGALPEGSKAIIPAEGVKRVPYTFEDFEGTEKIKDLPPTDLGWAVFVTVPVKAGEFVNIPIVMNIPAAYMIYDDSPAREGIPIYVPATIIGAFSADAWQKVKDSSDREIIASANIKYTQDRLAPITSSMTKEQYQRYLKKLKTGYPMLYELLITNEELFSWLFIGR